VSSQKRGKGWEGGRGHQDPFGNLMGEGGEGIVSTRKIWMKGEKGGD